VKRLQRRAIGPALAAGAAAAILVAATLAGLRPLPDSLGFYRDSVAYPRFVDRHGVPLTVTYSNEWNVHDFVALHDIPPLLQQAVLQAEDKRFYSHGGADWLARGHALVQNIAALRAVRGASTITEQVVRLLHPRPRTVWSRWLEGWEATRLEARFSKAEILEFYLNQVPYARRQRGLAQAARYYFDRSLDTLNTREMLSLAVLIRAPARLDPARDSQAVARAVKRLAAALASAGRLSAWRLEALSRESLTLHAPPEPVDAAHFVGHLRKSLSPSGRSRIETTLDASLQTRIQRILDTRLHDLRRRKVTDGAVLVVDHATDEILAWVNGGGYDPNEHGALIDAVTTPRQPGSALKPFLYALALERGWTASTLIDDSPLSEAVGRGLHEFENYSHRHYGPLRLRDALGNSLNVPAVRTVQYVGRREFLDRLHRLRFDSLSAHPDFYGDGLALGNGEVTLYELVRAYAALARHGLWRPLRATFDDLPADGAQRVFDPETATLIADILSDPDARRLEFGNGHLLNLPVQTAVKTGTSNDYRDAWAAGFSDRYTVGVWMGNLDRRPMNGVSGSIGPALVLRAVFAELNRFRDVAPLRLSPKLRAARVCRISGDLATSHCPGVREWFEPGTVPTQVCPLHHGTEKRPGMAIDVQRSIDPALAQPTPGLRIARDPRIPDDAEIFAFMLAPGVVPKRVEWLVDGRREGISGESETRFLWPLRVGRHEAQARIWLAGRDEPVKTAAVAFYVR
jgi:penicillin-binding protein 1C